MPPIIEVVTMARTGNLLLPLICSWRPCVALALHPYYRDKTSKEVTLICPRRPCLVHRSTGRNQRMSSGLWNIQRTTAFFFCTFTG